MNVSFTPSTLPLLLLTAVLWCYAKGQLLPVAMFMSVFQAASILNVSAGSLLIGVQPTYAISVFTLFARLIERRPAIGANWIPSASTTLLLGGFVLYAIVSAFVYPHLFEGVPISNPRLGVDVPLHWEAGHLNQLFYLLLSFAIYLLASYWTTPAELTKSLNWFAGGVVLASLLGLYQYLAFKTGLPFPADILQSNPAYAIFRAYEIDGFPRMNSTFTEAAAAAFSMTIALALMLWRLLAQVDSSRTIIQILIIGMGIALTVSTTGYICLLFLLLVAAWRYFAPWQGSAHARSLRALLAVPVLLFFLAAAGVPSLGNALVKLSHTVLFDKTGTESYQTRTAWNQSAFNTARETYFLGAGWGVCRASSFIPTVLGNVGVPGGILFVAFCTRVLWPASRSKRPKIQTHGAVVLGLSAMLLNLAVSSPELAHPIIWLLFAIAAKFAAARAPLPLMLSSPNSHDRRLHATA